MKKLCLITVLILLSVALCACSFDESENSFRGGELLDNNKMSEIKESLFTQESENAEESEVNTETVDEKATGKETVRPSENETDDQSEYVEAPVESENETDIVTEENGVVYWTKGGSVWHVSKGKGLMS